MALSSARNRPVAVGIITNTVYVDSYNDAIYSNIVYPTNISINVYANVDGSEPLNIAYVGDISGATGSSVSISAQTMVIGTIIPSDITGSTYPIS